MDSLYLEHPLSRTSLYLEQFSRSLSIDSSLIFSLYLARTLSLYLNKFLGPLRVRHRESPVFKFIAQFIYFALARIFLPFRFNLLFIAIRLSRIQLKFREISSCFILETDFRFEFLVRKYACAENFKYIRQRERPL